MDSGKTVVDMGNGIRMIYERESLLGISDPESRRLDRKYSFVFDGDIMNSIEREFGDPVAKAVFLCIRNGGILGYKRNFWINIHDHFSGTELRLEDFEERVDYSEILGIPEQFRHEGTLEQDFSRRMTQEFRKLEREYQRTVKEGFLRELEVRFPDNDKDAREPYFTHAVFPTEKTLRLMVQHRLAIER